MSAPRRRFGELKEWRKKTHTSSFLSADRKNLQVDGLGEFFWSSVFLIFLLIFVVIHINYHKFPNPAQTTEEGVARGDNHTPTGNLGNEGFVERNARDFLDDICKIGPRHVGSNGNEILAVEMIVKYLQEISTRLSTSKHANTVELNVQTPSSSCFDLEFMGDFTSCYNNVKNILVKLSPASKKSTGSLLVNCHYDTAISSPGASDDMVSCAIMLEALRVLSMVDEPLRHTIIFNFNGAEEVVLQASHGFITQHPWAKDLKAFVNLEAAGAGGREMVFQTGPEHPWLVAAYARSAKYPVGSIVGQEIFQSGIIPSDTDFRIYRDYGRIPGIDIAYTYNGYIYHTKHDLPQYIPEGCIQRGGENLLGLLTTLGNSDKLEEPGDLRMGKMVFFDVMGFFMVYYPHRIGEVMNMLVVVAVLLNLFRRLRSFRQSGGSAKLYLRLIGTSYAMHTAGFVTMIGCSVALGLLISCIHPMMWYTNNWLTFPVYTLPAIAMWILIHQRGKQLCETVLQLVSIWDIETIYFDSALLFWTILLAALTMAGVASAYICMLLVIFPLIMKQILPDIFNINMFRSPWAYLTLTAAGLLPPFLQVMQHVHHNSIFFMPLMGRSGSGIPPDLLIALISILPVVIFSTYLAGFLHISKDLTGLAVKFLCISLFFTLIGCFTSLGFPYSANPASPSPQRHAFHHFWREQYAYNGNLEKEDHGLLYIPFDYNEHRYLDDIAELKSMKLQAVDKDLAYGGFPYYLPLMPILSRYYVGDLEKPRHVRGLNVSHSREMIARDIVRHHFTCTGDWVYRNVYLTVVEGGQLIGWSFTPGTPIPTKMPTEITRNHYFVYTTSASSPRDLQFYLDIQVREGATLDKHWLDIGFGVHYLDGPESTTPELSAVLGKFPNWTVPLGWVATYQHYRF